ncbi:helix-turn-helix domain-containing protein [Cesiribacter sp. SM1]|uniref:AraC family transcriptional regulator n=1 Tax=Cesiribacter sp. SM1 TaxID=2861196 RepID=UPI001CD5920B
MKESNPFEIYTLEWLEENLQNQFAHLQRQDRFEIIWLKSGSGWHSINNYQYPLSSRKLYFIVPGQDHKFQIHPGSKGYVLSFTESFLHQNHDDFNPMHEIVLFKQFSEKPELAINTEIEEEMEDVLIRLLKETENYFLHKSEILSKLLKIFLIYLKRQMQASLADVQIDPHNHLLNNFLYLLENNFRVKKAVSYYASELFVTPNHLNHVIKKNTGFCARHHIQQRIILEAKKMALHKDASMKEIASYLGFDDVAHFSKFFKNAAGANFTSFKKNQFGALPS